MNKISTTSRSYGRTYNVSRFFKGYFRDDVRTDEVKRVELCVLDTDRTGSLDPSCSQRLISRVVIRLQCRYCNPVNGVNSGKRRKVESGQNSHPIDAKGVSDGLETVARQLRDLRDIVRNQTALDLLYPVQGYVVCCSSSNCNTARERGAARQR